jgi:DNA-binding transcriptional LysR family regulator
MELRRLRLLAELSRRGTIAAAADALAFSPSSVSVQLAELEREAGVPLLRRVGRTVRLTSAGLRLVEHAERAMAADEAVRAELATLAEEPSGRLVMSFVQTAALALLPSALATLAATAPRLRVELTHLETAPALDELRSRSVDLVVGIDYDPVPPPSYRGMHRRDLLREDVLLAVPTVGRFRARSAVAIGELRDSVWAAGARGGGHHAAVEYLCNRIGGYSPDIRHHTDDALILRALVSSGQAVSLLPALIGTATPRVRLRPVAEARLRRTVFTATRAGLKDAPAVVAVRDALTGAAREASADRDDVETLG